MSLVRLRGDVAVADDARGAGTEEAERLRRLLADQVLGPLELLDHPPRVCDAGLLFRIAHLDDLAHHLADERGRELVLEAHRPKEVRGGAVRKLVHGHLNEDERAPVLFFGVFFLCLLLANVLLALGGGRLGSGLHGGLALSSAAFASRGADGPVSLVSVKFWALSCGGAAAMSEGAGRAAGLRRLHGVCAGESCTLAMRTREPRQRRFPRMRGGTLPAAVSCVRTLPA